MRVARSRNCPSGGLGQKRCDPAPTRARNFCSDRVTVFLFESRQFLFDFFRLPSVDIQFIFPVKKISSHALESIGFGQLDGH